MARVYLKGLSHGYKMNKDPYKRNYEEFAENSDSQMKNFLEDFEPLNVVERQREEGVPVGLKNIGNTCYFNWFMQILFFVPEFGRKIIELDLSKMKKPIITSNSTRKETKLANNFENHKKLLAALQGLLIEMTLSNQKYTNPENLLNNILDEDGNRMKLGDEWDVGEIGSNFMNVLDEAYQIYDPDPVQDSSSESDNDCDTDMENNEEEKKEKI